MQLPIRDLHAATSPVRPAWQRNFVDLDREHGFEPLAVEGTVPELLRGTLYRVGPSLFSAQDERYGHWFDGDGAVTAVRFEGGRAEGAVRLVESSGLKAERAAGRALFGGYGTLPPGGLVRRMRAARTPKNVANISAMLWQGRLFALWEGGKPTELAPEDLSTLGEDDIGGIILRSFSAHPHRVTSRRAAYNFGVRHGRRTWLDLYELPDQGLARRLASLPLAGPTMIHDFIATERHLVFFAPPLRIALGSFLLGRQPYGDALRWHPAAGTEILVVPIDRPAQPLRFTADPFFQWHFANGWDDGERVIVELVRMADFRSNEWLGRLPVAAPSWEWDGRYARASLDLGARTVSFEVLLETPCEFPRISGRALGCPHRFTYLAAASSHEASRGLFDVLAKFDRDSGNVETASFGPDTYPSEPIFVRDRTGTAEADGWILTLVYDGRAHSSFVAVLDARHFTEGPIARAHLGHAVPFTFHGQFAPLEPS
ncbi:MAG TPA: carotenoid oxygenase family protein [Anaeromyxobacteraceae bacterium]|nr:carotenoid oxygenase family protein [Anaeromyxobacteraceae bacterium]